MSENVGTILGYLKLDRSEWDAEIDAAGAKARELGRSNPNVHISTNAGVAIAQLAAVSAAVRRLQDAQGNEAVAQARLTDLRNKDNVAQSKIVKAEQDVEKAHRATANAVIQLAATYESGAKNEERFSNAARAMKNDTSGLITTLLAVAPAIVPIAGVALGAVGAFGLLGAAGVLAVLGIKNEMAKGSAIGQQYASDVGVLKGNLKQLEHMAASGFLGPFNAAAQRAQGLMPALNAQIKAFSTIGGNIAGHVLGGLVGGFQTLNPLFQTLAVMLDHGAVAFDKWANSSTGLGKFGASVQQSLPQVVATLGSLAQAVGHIVGSIGPLGSVSLTILKTFADIINSLPAGAIQAIALAFITMRAAALGLNILSGVAKNLQSVSNVGQKLGGSGLGLARGFGAMGAAGLVAGVGIGLLSNYMSNNAKVAAEEAAATQSFVDALKQSKGAIDENVTATAAQTLQQNGAFKAAHVLGVSTDTVTQAALGNADAWKQVNEASKKNIIAGSVLIALIKNAAGELTDAKQRYKDYTDATTENNKALAVANPALASQAANLGLTITQLMGAKTTVDQKRASDQASLAVTKLLTSENYQLMGTQADLTTALGLTTQQQLQYAGMLGITQDAITQGKVSADAYANAVGLVSSAEGSATQTGSAFLSALQAFSASAGTAADRAALIGATLRAANGDNLSFANAMNGSAVAVKDLVDGVKRLPAEVGKSHLTIKDFIGSIVNLKTGTIDYTKSAAQPLIAGLQKVQDAAMAAAQAQYQHEVATKGGKLAADDAYKTYVSQTRGALIDEASQLGLTKGQAKRLADTYFGMPKDVKTKIEQEGADPIQKVLNSIKGILSAIATAWGIRVSADTGSAESNIRNVQSLLDALHDKEIAVRVRQDVVSGVFTNADKAASQPKHRAGGGAISGPGSGTSDDIPAWLSNGEYVIQSSAVKKYGRAFFDKANAMKLASGGAVGTAAAKAAKHAATVAQQRANIRFTVSTDLPRVFSAIHASVASLASTLSKVLRDVHAAATKGVGGNSVVDTVRKENADLLYAASRREAVVSRLKKAESLLAARQGQFNTKKSDVAQAFTGTFDITGSGGDAADIITSLQGDVKSAKSVSALVSKLRHKHLNNALLEKIATNPDSPNALALQNASSGQIAQINKLYGALGSSGNAAGSQVATAMYGAGVDAAKGLVNGLKSQEKTLAAQMTRLADVIVNTIRAKLRIHSPSRVTHELGEFVAQGMANGMQAKHATVRRAASNLAGIAVPSVTAGGSAAVVTPIVHVYLGDRELTDMVRVEVEHHTDSLADQFVYGRAS